jgi:acyl carrier protein
VRHALAKVLKVAPGRIDPAKPLGTMGLSSLLAMELRNHLEAATARALPATLAWNYPTMSALVGYLAGDETVSAVRGATNEPEEALAILLETAALSDAEAAAALRASA